MGQTCDVPYKFRIFRLDKISGLNVIKPVKINDEETIADVSTSLECPSSMLRCKYPNVLRIQTKHNVCITVLGNREGIMYLLLPAGEQVRIEDAVQLIKSELSKWSQTQENPNEG